MQPQLRQELFPQPIAARGVQLTADHMAEALVRAAMATGELSQLAYRYEAAIRGHCTLRARWVALAALLALHAEIPIPTISSPLGCGATPLRVLESCRRAAWWDEALVQRLFVDLVESADAPSLNSFESLRRSVASVLAERSEWHANSGGAREQG